MKGLYKFLWFSLADKALTFEVLFTVVSARLLLSLLPFRQIFSWSQKLEQRFLREGGSAVDDKLEKKLVHFVQAISKRVPAASCLTQALALQFLLARRGQHSELRIGVRKEDKGDFRAHAWLETCQGVAIGGGRHLSTYVPILSRAGQK